MGNAVAHLTIHGSEAAMGLYLIQRVFGVQRSR